MKKSTIIIFLLTLYLFGGVFTLFAVEKLEIMSAELAVQALQEAPDRQGPAPITPDGIPHQQHNQNAPVAMQNALKDAATRLPGIYFKSTEFSLAGSVGWRLSDDFAHGGSGAFIRNTKEFAHQHRPSDGSLHLLLPSPLAHIAVDKGWGIFHPWTASISGDNSDYLMIYGPRNEQELYVIWIIAQISYYQARAVPLD